MFVLLMINYDDYVASYNKQSMIALKNNQVAVAYNLLIQAKNILKLKSILHPEKLWALTFNNLGCFYKRKGELQTAIKYFHKSLIEGSKFDKNSWHLAGTHLNLCTIYSLIVDYSKALFHALQALDLLKKYPQKDEDYVFTLVMAYKNVAIEYENISEYKNSNIYYKKALNFALLNFGENNSITQALQERLKILQSKIDLWSSTSKNQSLKNNFEVLSHSCTPILKIKKKRLVNLKIFSQQRKPLKKLKNKYLNTETSEKQYQNLTKHFQVEKTKKKDSTECETLNSDTGKSLVSKRIKTTIKAKRNKKSQKYSKTPISHYHDRSFSKSPEVLPIPFKDKLNI